jgi:hypothetical protein
VKSNAGRPSIDIDFEELEKLCGLQCTIEELASWFNCSIDTIENKVKMQYGVNFSEFFKRFKNKGKVSLRRKQMQVAMSGDTKLLIHLGRHHLDQVDRQKIESDNTTKVVELSYEEYLKTLGEQNGES